MTAKEWNQGIEYLENGNIGWYIENDGRIIEITEMCGGRYLAYNEQKEICGQTDEEWRAMSFLKDGNSAVLH